MLDFRRFRVSFGFVASCTAVWLAVAVFFCRDSRLGAWELPGIANETLSLFEPIEIKPESRIVIIGNTLAERMANYGYWETLLHQRFPQHQLTVRNLGWSADEIDLRPRSKDFEDHGHTLADHQPDIVFAMFGFNESFAGDAGLNDFHLRLTKFVKETTSTAYNGSQPPQLILCSPIPHEDLGRSELPDGSSNNANIQKYMEVMRTVASNFDQCWFIDLFTPMLPLMQDQNSNLTINGIHLNDLGYRELSSVLDSAMFSGSERKSLVYDEATMGSLRAAIVERNQQFYYDYRAVNGYYIYGGRKNPYGVINFPVEFAKLRKMIEVRDRRIWDIASGKQVTSEIDDSQTGDLPTVESNVNRELVISSPQQALEKFVVSDGFRVELVASEVEFPDLENPVAFEFDNRGRLWVSTMPSYPMYLPGTPPNDKILIFEDTDNDGRMDKQTVFADGLHLPIGFALGDGGAYVSAQPNVLFLKDTDGDDVADYRETVLHGFDSADSHHSISAFTWGPGGGLYFQEGTFHHTQVETPYGPRRVKDAGVFRYEPKTEKFDIFVSYPFANPWGHCFDRWGQNFVADASPGANYFATAFSGDSIYPNKRRAMEQFLVKQWRPTCGCVIVSSRNFPEEMQGDYLLNNTIGFLGTLQYRMRDDRSGFRADPVPPLLQSKDPNFRPVDLTFGPDGALYIVDWFNPLIGHMQHSLRDPKRDKHHGRIWRVYNTRKPLVQKTVVAGQAVEDLVPMLGSYEDATRAAVRNELRLHKTADVMRVLDLWLDSLDDVGQLPGEDHVEHAHLEALWVAQHHDAVDRNRLLRVLRSTDPRARAAAVRVLCYWRDGIDDSNELLIKVAADKHPRVRLEAVRAASFLDAASGRKIIAEAVKHPLDYYLNYAIGETSSTLDQRGGVQADGENELVDQLASCLVPQPQLVSSVRNVARNATASQLAKVVLGILTGPYESQVKADALNETLSASVARKLNVPVEARKFLLAFDEAIESKRTSLAIVLANSGGQWQISGLEDRLRSTIFNNDSDGDLVSASLKALSKYSTPTSNDAISSLARQPIPQSLKLRAAAALVDGRQSIAIRMLKEALSEKVADYSMIKNVVDAWAGRSGGLKELNLHLKNVKLDTDTAKLLLRAVNATGESDAKILAFLRTAAGIEQDKVLTAAERAELIRRIELEGSAKAGESIFKRDELQCAKCHKVYGKGGQIGPDLTGIGATNPTEYLLDSILMPSQQIKEAYASLRVLTIDGRIYLGVKVDRDDDRLVLRDSEGRETTISVEDIEVESEGASLMPEGIQHLLTEQELVDLVAYLASLKTQEP